MPPTLTTPRERVVEKSTAQKPVISLFRSNQQKKQQRRTELKSYVVDIIDEFVLSMKKHSPFRFPFLYLCGEKSEIAK
jgi:hypothetical protein